MSTNWSSPKRTAIAGILDLRKALGAGHNAKLIRARNEDCEFPIREKKADEDFRNYKFVIGYQSTRRKICDASNMTDFEKYLSLNYKTCYGTPEAKDRYYKTGKLCPDNFKGIGVCHLVAIRDMITFYLVTGNKEVAEMYRSQYFDTETGDEQHFFDFFRPMRTGSPYAIKKFRRKLWVVDLQGKSETAPKVPLMVAILNVLLYPLKYIPSRSVLRMPDYKVVTYRVGAVTNGFSVEFHVPKKFSFK